MTYHKDIAVFGGSFDPPTRAHSAIVRACLADDRFDEVWIMPSGDRTDKPGLQSSGVRLAMLDLLIAEEFATEDRLHLSRFEIDMPQVTEMYRTYRALQTQFPGSRFWFVFGADSVADMHTWGHGAELLEQLPMAVVPRSGYVVPSEARTIRQLAIRPDSVQPVSSTLVRDRIARRASIEDMVCGSVAAYILCQRLYAAA